MPVSGLPPRLTDYVADIQDALGNVGVHLQTAKVYFEIPAWSEFSAASAVAWRDSERAWRSVWAFWCITLRPLIILSALLSRHVGALLQIVGKHTFHHAYVAGGKSLVQLKIGGREFVRFQRSLSRFWLYAELGVCLMFVALYLLRRLIIKRKYMERVGSWYQSKRNMVTTRYYDMVEHVAETSMTMALLMPHIIYVGFYIFLKGAMPSVLRYLANGTYITEIIALWHPVFRTVRLISVKTSQAKKVGNGSSGGAKKASEKKGSVASRWLNASSAPVKGRTSYGSPAEEEKTSKEKPMDIDTEASMLLRYWVVYGLIYSMLKALYLLPFVGPYLSATTIVSPSSTASAAAAASAKSSYWFLSFRKISSFFVPSPFFLFELKMAFFVWLRFLPKSEAANDLESTPNSSYAARKRKAKYDTLRLSPVDMIYKKLAPIALNLADKSEVRRSAATNRVNRNMAQSSATSFIASVGNKMSSILDLAVLIKVVSQENKDRIVTLVSESYALLPACVTLFMPSRFTAYGCIYAGAVIPAANCANCESALGPKGLLRGTPAYKEAKSARIRHLKYWVVHALFLLVLDTVFYTLLQWVPLSTHMTLIVWVFLNLPYVCNKAYEYLEYEMVAFGVLDVEHVVNYDVQKTITVRLFKKISSSIPVAEDEKKNDVDNAIEGDAAEKNEADGSEGEKDSAVSGDAPSATDVVDSTTDSKKDSSSSSGDNDLDTSVSDVSPSSQVHDSVETKDSTYCAETAVIDDALSPQADNTDSKAKVEDNINELSQPPAVAKPPEKVTTIYSDDEKENNESVFPPSSEEAKSDQKTTATEQ